MDGLQAIWKTAIAKMWSFLWADPEAVFSLRKCKGSLPGSYTNSWSGACVVTKFTFILGSLLSMNQNLESSMYSYTCFIYFLTECSNSKKSYFKVQLLINYKLWKKMQMHWYWYLTITSHHPSAPFPLSSHDPTYKISFRLLTPKCPLLAIAPVTHGARSKH